MMKKYYLSLIGNERKGPFTAFLKSVLHGLSAFYSAGVKGKRALYEKGLTRRRELPVPVISVGNLTWGGTGKTPLVIALAKMAEAMGKRPLVLTRGYGNDEALEIRENLPSVPVGVGKDRGKTGWEYLLKSKIDVVICDDAFQHWKLARDWDIVAVNVRAPFGNGFLIPRGNLREPLTALRRAQTVVLTHSDEKLTDVAGTKEAFLKIAPHLEFAEACHEPLFFYRTVADEKKNLESFRHIRAAVFCGIGSPGPFRESLEKLGVKVARFFEFPDHHRYTRKELVEIRNFLLKERLQDAITTEKDYFRSKKLLVDVLDPWVLKIEMRIKVGRERIEAHLAELIEKGKSKVIF